MEKIIALNHKMNLNYDELEDYVNKLKENNLDVLVFPTSIYAAYFIEHGFKTGLQNIAPNMGPYTGEISPKQAYNLGVSYVLVGHSERRMYFHETDIEINAKIKNALKENLKVILCVGEKADEDYKIVIKNQIQKALLDINDEIIVSYEPVWSIGNGNIPSNQRLYEVVNYIKSLFDYDVKVLYGGSVNSHTIETLKEVNVVSGYLIGGASTDINELIKIREVVK